MKKAVRKKNNKRQVLFRRRKHKPLFIEIHRTTRGILVLYLFSGSRGH